MKVTVTGQPYRLGDFLEELGDSPDCRRSLRSGIRWVWLQPGDRNAIIEGNVLVITLPPQDKRVQLFDRDQVDELLREKEMFVELTV